LLSFIALSARAEARQGGIASQGCDGCHGRGDDSGKLSLSAMPAMFEPGQRVELSLSLTGPYADGGTYVSTGGVGELQIITGEGLKKVSSGLVHERPKPASGGSVQFRFAWTAPAQVGAVQISVWALGGNGDNRSSGDAAFARVFEFAFGCVGQTYYLDSDGDGAGRPDISQLACSGSPPQTYVADYGDCDDYNKSIHPGAPELCNQHDDDCNGEVDENVVPVELWPDADGDGYYDARTEKVGTPLMGCNGLKGWAALPGDCQPMNKAINPRAQEVCNALDDDCDGEVDERVRPTCGEGWCRRESPTCDLTYCRPGVPERETCNLLDDDCDGEIDEDAELCPLGQLCDGAVCVTMSSTAGTGGGGAGMPASTAGSPPAGGGGSISPMKDPASCALGARHGQQGLALLALAAWAAAIARRRFSP
jgi:hypothetical protein